MQQKMEDRNCAVTAGGDRRSKASYPDKTGGNAN
jgi:hypothetical protein